MLVLKRFGLNSWMPIPIQLYGNASGYNTGIFNFEAASSSYQAATNIVIVSSNTSYGLEIVESKANIFLFLNER